MQLEEVRPASVLAKERVSSAAIALTTAMFLLISLASYAVFGASSQSGACSVNGPICNPPPPPAPWSLHSLVHELPDRSYIPKGCRSEAQNMGFMQTSCRTTPPTHWSTWWGTPWGS